MLRSTDNDNHLRYTIAAITIISIAALVGGTCLVLRGYQSGEIEITIASSGLSGLVGFLGGRLSTNAKQPDAPDPVTSDVQPTPPIPPVLPGH